MKFSMTRQEKGDLLIQVTAWAGFTVFSQTYMHARPDYSDYHQICGVICNFLGSQACIWN